eukprot:gnl/MRDRNA2_/MRDRNA2_429457_c0_seq1.p1 gnl/MRDRNA2_/MRDRNA2_429457_c0~~gnl/MRDRNA2_/MRDRNA2_429457_c0_seq1.p1  ORF type:complete len:114 (+),score=11.81 gnl/MRDRNA2_/MRDRNA2_429457_c0_seq1:1-342(+)
MRYLYAPQSAWILDDDCHDAVDYIFKYEEIKSVVPLLVKALTGQRPKGVPKFNPSKTDCQPKRPCVKAPKPQYDLRSIAIVRKVFWYVIERFGYEPPEHSNSSLSSPSWLSFQ